MRPVDHFRARLAPCGRGPLAERRAVAATPATQPSFPSPRWGRLGQGVEWSQRIRRRRHGKTQACDGHDHALREVIDPMVLRRVADLAEPKLTHSVTRQSPAVFAFGPIVQHRRPAASGPIAALPGGAGIPPRCSMGSRKALEVCGPADDRPVWLVTLRFGELSSQCRSCWHLGTAALARHYAIAGGQSTLRWTLP